MSEVQFGFGSSFDPAKSKKKYKTNKIGNGRLDSLPTKVLRGGDWVSIKYQDIVCGDIFQVGSEEYFPADAIFCRSQESVCVLDGAGEELTRYSLDFTSSPLDWNGLVRCTLPTHQMFSFQGLVETEGKTLAVKSDHFCPRGFRLKSRKTVVCIAVHVGRNCTMILDNKMDIIERALPKRATYSGSRPGTNRQPLAFSGSLGKINTVFVHLSLLVAATLIEQFKHTPTNTSWAISEEFSEFKKFILEEGNEHSKNILNIIAVFYLHFTYPYILPFGGSIQIERGETNKVSVDDEIKSCFKIIGRDSEHIRIQQDGQDIVLKFDRSYTTANTHYTIFGCNLPENSEVEENDYSDLFKVTAGNVWKIGEMSTRPLFKKDILSYLIEENIPIFLFTSKMDSSFYEAEQFVREVGFFTEKDQVFEIETEDTIVPPKAAKLMIKTNNIKLDKIKHLESADRVLSVEFSPLAIGRLIDSFLEKGRKVGYITHLENQKRKGKFVQCTVNYNFPIEKLFVTHLMSETLPLTERQKQTLDLSGRNLLEIPPFKLRRIESDTLTSIDLSNNLLEYIPTCFAKLTKLKTLNVSNNPLRSIPQEIRSWEKLKPYLQSLSKACSWSRCKLIIVGQEAVGKTTLAKAIKTKKGKVNCKKNISTNGIEIEKSISFSKSSEIVFDLWDFGGQEIFYPTHQFFLTDRAVYLVVFRCDNLVESRIEYWMKTIKYLTDNSPYTSITMVGTHLDKIPDSVMPLLQQLDSKYTKQFYRGMNNIIAVSSATGQGIQELVDVIETLARGMKAKLPIVSEAWVQLYSMIENIATTSKRNYANWDEFTQWAYSLDIPAQEHKLVAEFLTTTGTITYFDDPVGGLDDFVVINPQWLTSIMASVVTFQHSFIKNGILDPKNIPHVFKQHPSKLRGTILTFLEKYKIILHLSKKNLYLVPSLLPETIPTDEILLHWKYIPNEEDAIRIVEQGKNYKFSFLPMGFVPQLLGRVVLVENAEVLVCWRNGFLFKRLEELAFITFDPIEYFLTVRVRFPSELDKSQIVLLSILTGLISSTIQVLYNSPDENFLKQTIPCSHCLSKQKEEGATIVEFVFADCVAAVMQSKTSLLCGNDEVPLHQLAPESVFCSVPIVKAGDITIETKLGQGGFGAVYKGAVRHGVEWKPVAIKELSHQIDNQNENRMVTKFTEFMTEVSFMRQISHPNIVQLYGVQIEPCLRMIMEIIPHGDLSKLLQKGSRVPLCWELRLSFALDIAAAMAYFDSNHFVHRDLRTENILVHSLDAKDPVRAKLADFGLARQIIKDSNECGHEIWIYNPPERLAENKYDIKSDVYSFAICMWEIATRSIPYAELEDNDEFYKIVNADHKFVDLIKVKNAICKGLRPTLDNVEPGCPPEYVELIEECWSGDREARPSFENIHKKLAEIIEIINPKEEHK